MGALLQFLVRLRTLALCPPTRMTAKRSGHVTTTRYTAGDVSRVKRLTRSRLPANRPPKGPGERQLPGHDAEVSL